MALFHKLNTFPKSLLITTRLHSLLSVFTKVMSENELTQCFVCFAIYRARSVYVCGQLVYCVGMIFMALSRSKWGVLLFSWSAGVMYSTLFTMPYLLVAHYHETDKVTEVEPQKGLYLNDVTQILIYFEILSWASSVLHKIHFINFPSLK